GNAESCFGCLSLEELFAALRLPHALAGVTLPSLGNGALVGALFVTTVVASVVALAAVVEMRGFVRDLCFLFFALCNLVRVLVSGMVNVWVTASFVSIYVAYVVLVWTSQCCAEPGKPPHPDLAASLLLEDDDDDVPLLPSYSPRSRRLHDSSLPALPRVRAPHAVVPPAPPHHPGHRRAPLVSAQRRGLRRAGARAPRHDVELAQHGEIILAPRRHHNSDDHAILLAGGVLGLLLAALAAATTDAASPPHGRPRAVAGGGVPDERTGDLGIHPGA
uniref:Sodium/calcium exchanger membrane region domain-containing protein n=1 Tax=Aegilops tauschii subsp. strangulata TaxID=200361 RepID=A0A453S304_AEGTS